MSLPPLLERIYATGQVETEDGEVRSALPVGVPRNHALCLADLVRRHDLRATLETGMAYGLSTLAIAGVHAERGAGTHIAIDPLAERGYDGVAAANLRRAGLDRHVRVIEAGSQLALPRLVEEGVRLDFAFIDGMHLFDYALIDFFYVDQLLATGGHVAFHDAWMPAVEDAVSFVLANRAYEAATERAAGMAILRKVAPDGRTWNHYRPFARPRGPQRTRDENARDLQERLREGAVEAAGLAGGYRDHDLLLAGRRVRMRFTGAAVEEAYLPAFRHALAAAGDGASGPADLEILLWDSAPHGLAEPPVPWELGDVRVRGDVRGYDDGELGIFCEPSSGAVIVYDPAAGTMVCWAADARIVAWHERGAPLRPALHRWAAHCGVHFVHGAAVGADGRGVVLAGASGSGKSTTSLACLDAGMEFAGDDYVILDGEEPARAHCLYSTAKVDAAALARLPGLRAAVVDPARDGELKSVVDACAHPRGRVRPSLPVDAVVVPTVEQRDQPVLRRATGAQALRALAPTTLLQLPGAAQPRMAAMARLVRGVPTFDLRLGTDLGAAVELVARVCADPGGAWRSAAPAD